MPQTGSAAITLPGRPRRRQLTGHHRTQALVRGQPGRTWSSVADIGAPVWIETCHARARSRRPACPARVACLRQIRAGSAPSSSVSAPRAAPRILGRGGSGPRGHLTHPQVRGQQRAAAGHLRPGLHAPIVGPRAAGQQPADRDADDDPGGREHGARGPPKISTADRSAPSATTQQSDQAPSPGAGQPMIRRRRWSVRVLRSGRVAARPTTRRAHAARQSMIIIGRAALPAGRQPGPRTVRPPAVNSTARSARTRPEPGSRTRTEISPTRRTPCWSRLTCTTACSADASWACSADRGSPPSAAKASSRAGTSAAELACTVPQPPSCPVFIAVSRSQISGTADLTHHQSVRPHPQRLPDQVGQGDRPGEFGIGRAGLQAYDVRMVRRELPRVLHDHDPLLRPAPVPSRLPSSVVLPEPVPPLTRKASRAATIRRSSWAPPVAQRPRRDAVVQGEGAGREHPQRDAGARIGHRSEHGVDPAAVGQPGIHERHRVVESPAHRRRQPLRQPAHLARHRRTGARSAPARRLVRRTPGRGR